MYVNLFSYRKTFFFLLLSEVSEIKPRSGGFLSWIFVLLFSGSSSLEMFCKASPNRYNLHLNSCQRPAIAGEWRHSSEPGTWGGASCRPGAGQCSGPSAQRPAPLSSPDARSEDDTNTHKSIASCILSPIIGSCLVQSAGSRTEAPFPTWTGLL